MRHVLKTALILLALVLQSTWVQHMSILGVTPNIVLAVIIAMGLLSEPVESGLYGLFAGVIWDILWGRVFGLNVLLFMYVALLIRIVIDLMYKKGLFVTVALTFVSAVLYETIFFLLSFAIWGERGFLYVFLRVIIPSAAYTGIAQILIFGVISILLLGRHERRDRYEI